MEENEPLNIFIAPPDVTVTPTPFSTTSSGRKEKEMTTCTTCGTRVQQSDGFVLNGFPTCAVC